jgi:PII-like signaling protein
LRKAGIAGATVLRGIEGFGASSRIHTANILRLSQDLPIVIEAVDKPERIKAILAELSDMVQDGLITTEDINIVKYQTTK